MRAAWLLLPFLATSLATSAACLRQTEFRCSTNEQCTPNGTCQTSVGYCSFPDSACGQRFGDSAGPYAGQCVGGMQPGAEAGIDAPGTIDGPPAVCPTNFAPLAGAPAGSHVYRKLPTNANWSTQLSSCTALSAKAYLAVPNDATELMGLATVAAAAIFWVGIDDQVTEGQYIQANGGPATFLPWATGQPDNAGGGGGQDCVAATSTTFSDEDCSGGGGASNRPAVCECEP
jgi:hypothetical protein